MCILKCGVNELFSFSLLEFELYFSLSELKYTATQNRLSTKKTQYLVASEKFPTKCRVS